MAAQLPNRERHKLAPARECVAAALAVMCVGQFLEFKSWDGLEELREYGRMVSHSLVSRFQSMAYGELIVSKSPAIPGYFVLLSGIVVGRECRAVRETSIHWFP